jgi:hypothetical protein
MHFKEWLTLSESIQIQDGYLGRSRESADYSEFSYSSGEYWSTFSIRPYNIYREGYANMRDGTARIIAIIKNTAIFPDNGTDRAFIKGLTERLKANGKQPIPYKEGQSAWSGAINTLDFDDKEKFTKALQGDNESNDSATPQMGKGNTGTTKVSSISFSRESGSWAYIFRTPYAMKDIGMVEKIMKEVAQPMIDNDIMEFWQLVRGNKYGSAETMYSKRGQKEQDDETQFEQKASAYMKFLAEKMLSNHPKAMKSVIENIEHGKISSRASNVKPENTRVPISELRKYIQTYHHESSYLWLFLDAVEKDDQKEYEALELLADHKNQEYATYLYRNMAKDEYSHIVEHPLAYSRDALEIFRMQDILERLTPENFSRFKREYEESLNDHLENERTLRQSDLETLKSLSEFINVRDKDQIHDLHSKSKQKEEEENKKQEEEKSRENDMMERGRYMYMLAGDSSWKHIADKHIDGDDVQAGELAMDEDLIDKEDVFMAAHEKASDEAMENAEEKKSPNYGQDEEEVLSDLNYEIDDYVEDRFSDGEFEGLSDEEAQKKVKDEYLDDFIDWKKERLEKEEEEESWKYEPEPDQSDIWKYEKEIAEDRAYEEGLIIFKWPEENDEIDVWVHSKYKDKAKDMVRKSIQIGMKEKNEFGEPRVRRYTKVVFVYHDDKHIEKIPAENV